MTLYIISKDSTAIRPIIRSICESIGLIDYYILDPNHDDIDRAFKYVLFIKERPPKTITYKEWTIPFQITKELSVELKQKVMQAFKVIKKVIDDEAMQKQVITSNEIPQIKNFETFINEFKGCYFSVKLPDKRSIGIYPDNERLQGQNDIEYHVSTVLNLIKINELFKPTQISLKQF